MLSGAELVNPYSEDGSKREQVEKMFDSIAPAYDFMNTAMTFGLHRHWRNRAISAVAATGLQPKEILDIATGTGDVAFELHRRFPEADILGIDLSEGMLDVAKRKLSSMNDLSRSHISFRQGDSLALDLPDNSRDLITVAYGVRNFEHLKQGYEEMSRVLRPGGMLCVIELARPEKGLTRAGYDFYSKRLIPAIGRLVSGDSRAYSYLPESIAAAPQRKAMTDIMSECGFSEPTWHQLTFGAVCYYLAIKK